MNIYNDYINQIRAILKDNSTITESNLRGYEGDLKKGLDIKLFSEKFPKHQLQPSLDAFANQLGVQPIFNQKLGLHPDFEHLKTSYGLENHYIVSMFIDIKGSTNLFVKYTPETVFYISQVIQTVAIHTMLLFNGYIHRLQGDGLFVYFGRKGMEKTEAVEKALQAASLFTHFVKNDLKNIFNEEGIENIYTRIGVDLGYDRDVIWGLAGIGEISEVTTVSLHTSLASKMQSSAPSNGIITGDNIKSELRYSEDYMIPVSQRTGRENDRYIFRIPDQRFFYTQYDFNWEKFLKSQDFMITTQNGEIEAKIKTTNPNPIYIKPYAEKSTPYSNY